MGRYQSPLVKHDLSRLEDPEGRHIALTSLKNCVKQLDPECISFFLDQIAEAHQDVSRPYVISLYEDLARMHRSLLVPYIPRIMDALITSLSESGSSLHVHEACAKVVAGLSKYCIDMERLSQQAKDVLRLVCEPLLSVLVGKFEPVSAGAAVSVQALVESENWTHASRELVNEVCFRVTAAISRKCMPTVAHMQLACTVIRVNKEALEGYAVDLLSAGKDILQTPSSWTLRVAAAQLLNAILSVVDGGTFSMEICAVIDVLERNRLDRMPKVRSAVGEALRTARACYYSGEGATTKMIFSVGGSQTPREDAGIGSILLPGHDSGSKRDVRSKKPIVTRNQPRARKHGGENVAGVDFVIIDDYGHQQVNGRKSMKSPTRRSSSKRQGRPNFESPRVRHTVSSEPGGYLIQEWIKVDDRSPQCGMLADIDEGDEYYEPSIYGQQFYSPLTPSERHVVIFDDSCAATTTCKRLIEEPRAGDTLPPPEVSEPARVNSEPSGCSRSVQDDKNHEWSVRDNPIARKSDGTPYERSLTPPRSEQRAESSKESSGEGEMRTGASAACLGEAEPDARTATAEVSFQLTESDEVLAEASADQASGETVSRVEQEETSVVRQNSIDPAVQQEDVSRKSDMDSTTSNDGSFVQGKSNVTEEMVDTFRRSWEVLETEEHVENSAVEVVEVGSSSSDQLVKAISTSFSVETSQHQPEEQVPAKPAGLVADGCCCSQWRCLRKLQNTFEGLLGGSVCAVLALPLLMAILKFLESSFGCMELVPT